MFMVPLRVRSPPETERLDGLVQFESSAAAAVTVLESATLLSVPPAIEMKPDPNDRIVPPVISGLLIFTAD